MTSTVRWEPVDDLMTLRDAMNRLIEESFVRVRPFMPARFAGGGISLDAYETPEAVIVKAELPGVKPEEVDITMSEGVLTLKVEAKEEREVDEECYICRERRLGKAERTVRLSADLDPEKATAEFENGILTLTLPKREEAKPKIIEIRPKPK